MLMLRSHAVKTSRWTLDTELLSDNSDNTCMNSNFKKAIVLHYGKCRINAAFTCSSNCPISWVGKSLFGVWCVHVRHLRMWQQCFSVVQCQRLLQLSELFFRLERALMWEFPFIKSKVLQDTIMLHFGLCVFWSSPLNMDSSKKIWQSWVPKCFVSGIKKNHSELISPCQDLSGALIDCFPHGGYSETNMCQ